MSRRELAVLRIPILKVVAGFHRQLADIVRQARTHGSQKLVHDGAGPLAGARFKVQPEIPGQAPVIASYGAIELLAFVLVR